MNIIAVILAAGRGTRFGDTKQLARINDETMVARVSNTVAAAEPGAVVLVAGHDRERVHAAADLSFVVVNERYEDGLGASISTATAALGASADALLFCLADQPLIPTSHFEALMEAWDRQPDGVVATGYAGKAGAPVLFGSGWFEQLVGLSGDKGAQALLNLAADRVVTVPSDEAAHDVDTPSELSALHSRA